MKRQMYIRLALACFPLIRLSLAIAEESAKKTETKIDDGILQVAKAGVDAAEMILMGLK